MEGISVVDIDGSFMYRKCQWVVEPGKSVTLRNHPSSSPSVWKVVGEGSYKDVTLSIALVTTGKIIIASIISDYGRLQYKVNIL